MAPAAGLARRKLEAHLRNVDVKGLGFRIKGSGFRVQGVVFRV
jgi:hypothetical protein